MAKKNSFVWENRSTLLYLDYVGLLKPINGDGEASLYVNAKCQMIR